MPLPLNKKRGVCWKLVGKNTVLWESLFEEVVVRKWVDSNAL